MTSSSPSPPLHPDHALQHEWSKSQQLPVTRFVLNVCFFRSDNRISESEPEPAINSSLELPLPARSADPQIRKMQRYVPGPLVSVGCSARKHGKIACLLSASRSWLNS
ncbi:hypothetical protein IAS59_003062 [Cryptococcus gattii]